MIESKSYYFNLFQLDQAVLDRLIAEALSAGGGYADLYFENTTYGSLLLRDGAVTSGGNHIDFGVGVRVLSGEKTGYAYSESTAWEDMLSSARAAAQIADSSAPVSPYGTRNPSRGEPNPAADRYPLEKPWRGTPMSAFLPFLQKLEAEVRGRDTRIVKIIANLAFQVSDILMYNSARELKWDTRPMGSLSLSVVFQRR